MRRSVSKTYTLNDANNGQPKRLMRDMFSASPSGVRISIEIDHF